jgi:hypothetical protein
LKQRSTIQSVTSAFADIRNDYAAAQPSRFRRTRRNLGGNADAHYYSEQNPVEIGECDSRGTSMFAGRFSQNGTAARRGVLR